MIEKINKANQRFDEWKQGFGLTKKQDHFYKLIQEKKFK